MSAHDSVTDGGSVAAGAPMAPMCTRKSERCRRNRLQCRGSERQHQCKNKIYCLKLGMRCELASWVARTRGAGIRDGAAEDRVYHAVARDNERVANEYIAASTQQLNAADVIVRVLRAASLQIPPANFSNNSISFDGLGVEITTSSCRTALAGRKCLVMHKVTSLKSQSNVNLRWKSVAW